MNAANVKALNVYSCSREPISEQLNITCHMKSHSIICYPTHVNAPPRLNNHASSTRFTYPGAYRDKKLSWSKNTSGWDALLVRRVPTGQGKLESVREFVLSGKVRKNVRKSIIFEKSGKS